MRVVGGAWRGRPLVAPAGRGTRPTSDKVREAIFDVLQALPETAAGTGLAALAGHAVLDLYAGSGALGIEALSRGAARCTFVERDRAALSALRRNLAALGVTTVKKAPAGAGQSGGRGADGSGGPAADAPPAARVVATDVRRALQADARVGSLYTLVLADPPYARSADAQDALSRLLGPVLAPQAVIVVETSGKAEVQLPWRLVRVKMYGDTKVAVLAAG
jgi:16S rRNA G966 N2-methylase RsmD